MMHIEKNTARDWYYFALGIVFTVLIKAFINLI